MKPKYVIRRNSGRIVSGVFSSIDTLAMAQRLLSEWQHNYPNENFRIETV